MAIGLDFNAAKAKHLQFKNRLRSILFGEIAVDENIIVSQYACPVGKWIYKEALAEYHHINEVIEMEKVHADLHITAKTLLDLYKINRKEEAIKGLEEIETTAEKLMLLLDAVQLKIKEDEGIVLHDEEPTDHLLKELLLKNQVLDEKIRMQALEMENQSVFYGKLLAISPAVLWMTNAHAEIIYINETWAKWVGIGKVDSVLEQWFSSMHLDDREKVELAFKKSFETQTAFEVEYKMIGEDDTIRFCLATGNPFYAGNTEFVGFTGSITDITQRVLTEQILQKKMLNENDTLHKFFMQAPAALCILRGPQHIFEFTNPNYEKLINNRVVIGKPARDALPEIEGQGFFELLDDVYKNNEPYSSSEMAIRLKTGDEENLKYINLTYQPFVNELNETEGVFAFVYDVTDTVTTKNAIENSEEELRNVIDNTPFPIGVYIGKDLRIHIANRNIIEVFGKGPDVIGKSYKTLLPELESQQIITQMETVLETGIAFHAKNIKIYINHNEEIVTLYFNYSFIPLKDAQGKTYGIVNTAADVTDINVARLKLELSEKRFRSMADFMPQFVWTANINGELNYFNKAVYDYSGHTEESIADAGWLSIVHPNDADRNVELWSKSITEGTNFNFEHRFRNKNGEYRWQLSRAVPLKDENGDIQSWVGISSDIHDQKDFAERLEKMVNERTELLKKANADLAKSNSELSQFAYVASHDLQEPLRKIRTFVSRIKNDAETSVELRDSYIDKINVSAERMSNLIKDILEFSSVGKTGEQKTAVDLNKIFSAILSDLEVEIQQKNAEIITDVLPVINAMPSQINQLFHNLLSNSLKFTNAHIKPIISISIETVMGINLPAELNGNIFINYHKIIFKDNGIGFEQQYANLIFTIFQRLHQKSLYKGTGIGLALCKKIIDNHNGFIYAESKENEGAAFFIYLPAEL